MLPVPSTDIFEALKSKDELLQLEVCSSYNFHAEEDFKVAYWRKVISETLPQYLGSFSTVKLTAGSLREWWSKRVAARSLSGLNGVLGALLASGEFWLASEAEDRGHRLFDPPKSALISLMTSLSSWMFSSRGVRSVREEEILVLLSPLENFARHIISELADSRGTAIVLEEAIVSKLGSTVIPTLGGSIPPAVLGNLILLYLTEKMGGYPFVVQGGRGVRVLVSGRKSEPPSVEERSRVAQQIAVGALDRLEAELERRMVIAENKCREQLREGRKALAAGFLREKKSLESKIADLHALRLKIAENASISETAKIQQLVVDTLSQAGLPKAEILSLAERAEKVQEDMTDFASSLEAVRGVFATSSPDLDSELAAELAELTETSKSEDIVLPPVPTHAIESVQEGVVN